MLAPMTDWQTQFERARAMLADRIAVIGKRPESLSVRWPEGSEADRDRLARALESEFGFPVKVVADAGELSGPETVAVRAAMALRKQAGQEG